MTPRQRVSFRIFRAICEKLGYELFRGKYYYRGAGIPRILDWLEINPDKHPECAEVIRYIQLVDTLMLSHVGSQSSRIDFKKVRQVAIAEINAQWSEKYDS